MLQKNLRKLKEEIKKKLPYLITLSYWTFYTLMFMLMEKVIPIGHLLKKTWNFGSQLGRCLWNCSGSTRSSRSRKRYGKP